MRNVFACPHCSGPVMLSTQATAISRPDTSLGLEQQAYELASQLLADANLPGQQAAQMLADAHLPGEAAQMLPDPGQQAQQAQQPRQADAGAG